MPHKKDLADAIRKELKEPLEPDLAESIMDKIKQLAVMDAESAHVLADELIAEVAYDGDICCFFSRIINDYLDLCSDEFWYS